MSDKLVKRLRELSDAVTRECWSEFYMRVPAEPDHDGDLVLMLAADRIATLERENAELRFSSTTFQHLLDAEKTLRAFDAENFAELEQISGENIGELVFTQFENERFRAHIQEAADDAKSNEMASAVNGECYQVKYFNKLRDFHLAALQPKEPTNG